MTQIGLPERRSLQTKVLLARQLTNCAGSGLIIAVQIVAVVAAAVGDDGG